MKGSDNGLAVGEMNVFNQQDQNLNHCPLSIDFNQPDLLRLLSQNKIFEKTLISPKTRRQTHNQKTK
jgi:hypothetical protein